MSAEDAAIRGPQYVPSSVTVELRDGKWCLVDRSYADAEHVYVYGTGETARTRAHTGAHRRRSVIKAALTRRRNKRSAARTVACKEAGVTWAWLTTGEHNLSPAEADAWLGLD